MSTCCCIFVFLWNQTMSGMLFICDIFYLQGANLFLLQHSEKWRQCKFLQFILWLRKFPKYIYNLNSLSVSLSESSKTINFSSSSQINKTLSKSSVNNAMVILWDPYNMISSNFPYIHNIILSLHKKIFFSSTCATIIELVPHFPCRYCAKIVHFDLHF